MKVGFVVGVIFGCKERTGPEYRLTDHIKVFSGLEIKFAGIVMSVSLKKKTNKTKYMR